MSANTIIIIISAATLLVSIAGIVFGWLWHKDSVRRNFKQELARIDIEIADIEAQQEDARIRGEAALSGIYSAGIPNPNGGVIAMLEFKKRALLVRKAEIERQLKQL